MAQLYRDRGSGVQGRLGGFSVLSSAAVELCTVMQCEVFWCVARNFVNWGASRGCSFFFFRVNKGRVVGDLRVEVLGVKCQCTGRLSGGCIVRTV